MTELDAVVYKSPGRANSKVWHTKLECFRLRGNVRERMRKVQLSSVRDYGFTACKFCSGEVTNNGRPV